MKKFDTHVCQKGCKVPLHGGTFRKDVVLPAIVRASKEMGISEHQRGAIVQLADDLAKVVRHKCGRTLGKKRDDICQDSETFAKFGKCIENNIPAAIADRAGHHMPLVTEPMCQKEKAYLENPQLYEKVIPSLLDKYAATCKKA